MKTLKLEITTVFVGNEKLKWKDKMENLKENLQKLKEKYEHIALYGPSKNRNSTNDISKQTMQQRVCFFFVICTHSHFFDKKNGVTQNRNL